MAPLLPDHFDSPILSTLIHVHNLAVSVGDDGQLIVIAVPPDVMPPVFHFKRVEGPFPESVYYEISFRQMNTLVGEESKVLAITGAAPHKWIVEYQQQQGAYTILEMPIFPSRLWTVTEPDRKIFITTLPMPPYQNTMLFKILPVLE